MIDESLKIMFLKSQFKQESFQSMFSILNSIGKFEDECGKDFSQFEKDYLNNAVSSISCIKNHSNDTIIYLLRKYVSWRKESGFDCNDNIYSVEIDNSDKIKSMMVSSPTHLLSVLNEVLPLDSDSDINYIYRTYLWLAFLGLTECEAISLEEKDIDLDGFRILNSYPIYKEAIDDIDASIAMDHFIETKTLNGEKVVRMLSRDIGNRVLRGRFNPRKKTPYELLKATIRPTIARKFKNSRYSLSYDRVRISGLFYRLYCKDSLSETALDINNIKHLFESYDIRHSNINSTIAEYHNWKETYY